MIDAHVLLYGEHRASVIDPVQAEVVVLKKVHVLNGVMQEAAQQHPHGPAVHADQDDFLLGPRKHQVDKGVHSGRYIPRALPALDPGFQVARGPVADKLGVFIIILRPYFLSFFFSPANLIKGSMSLVRKAPIKKRLHALNGPLEGGGVNFIEGYMFILTEETGSLVQTRLIQARVDPTPLHNVLQVIVRLPVADKVYFFNAQFCSTFAPFKEAVSC